MKWDLCCREGFYLGMVFLEILGGFLALLQLIIQIMRRSIFMTALAVAALASCNRIDTPEMGSNALDISVRNGMGTKAVIEGTTLPSGSEIGVFVTDISGVTYEANMISNAKYSAVGENESQIWNNSDGIMLTETKATVNSYYPYDESVTNITAIPIEATSDVQKDWMWGSTVTDLNNANNNAVITMNHALAAVRLNITKGNYTGEGKVTLTSIEGPGIAYYANLNAITGALDNIKRKGGVKLESKKEFTLSNDNYSVDFITIPNTYNGSITIRIIIDGIEMKVSTASFVLKAGNIYDCNLSINTQSLVINKLNVTEWTIEKMGDVELQPYSPKVEFTIPVLGQDYIRVEYDYDSQRQVLTFKIIPLLEGYVADEVKVSGCICEQNVDENGVRTLIMTDIVSTIKITFNNNYGATFVPWARIQHVDGTLYTAEEWLAAETAGTVTDADANGIAIRYSKYVSCPFVIYPQISTSTYKWSSNTSIEIPGVNTTSSTSKPTIKAEKDVFGKSNTDALLEAIATGRISDAPAAQYCADITFANGQKGYLPAAGETMACVDNINIINTCLEAIGFDPISSETCIWSSTQSFSYAYYSQLILNGKSDSSNRSNNYKVLAVTSLEL